MSIDEVSKNLSNLGPVSTDPGTCEYGEKFVKFGLAFPLMQ